ncbi:MAG: radical SAM protein, partial [Ignavibacteriaceae bacterium]|nr:radical SAM protein [Ignavibacteriaceae bacterium]
MKKTLLAETIRRFYALKFHKIYSLPIVILMPHSRCNCRCVMCDIWKGNSNVKQLEEKDVEKLLGSLQKLNTKLIVMSGGEALMHPNFFRLCEIIKARTIKITLLSTGLLLKKYANEIISNTDEVIVSLDGSREVHDKIRNIPGAYEKLREGVQELKKLDPNFRITARCVIQKENFDDFPNIVDAARELGLDQISFLA